MDPWTVRVDAIHNLLARKSCPACGRLEETARERRAEKTAPEAFQVEEQVKIRLELEAARPVLTQIRAAQEHRAKIIKAPKCAVGHGAACRGQRSWGVVPRRGWSEAPLAFAIFLEAAQSFEVWCQTVQMPCEPGGGLDDDIRT